MIVLILLGAIGNKNTAAKVGLFAGTVVLKPGYELFQVGHRKAERELEHPLLNQKTGE